MFHKYQKINIKELTINREFDYQSKNKIVKLNSEGVCIDLCVLNRVRTLGDHESIKTLHELNYKLCNTLNIDPQDPVKWNMLLGEEACRSYSQNLIREIKFSKNLLTSYHSEILLKRKSLYENLNQILGPDGEKLEVPIYNHSGISGRTTIKSGFNFLTSSKEFRSNCKVTEKDNFLVSIDFKACEPNLYLRALGKKIKNSDVYNYLMSELNIKVNDRSKLKRGILAVLFGAGDSTAKKILGGDTKTLQKIKKFFEIEEAKRKLQEQFDNQKYIFNMYGRPIFSDKSILNKWIQSSAVDFCSLAFLDLVRNRNLRVAYILHDDMVVICNNKKFKEIKDLTEITDPYSNISLPVEITKLG